MDLSVKRKQGNERPVNVKGPQYERIIRPTGRITIIVMLPTGSVCLVLAVISNVFFLYYIFLECTSFLFPDFITEVMGLC